MYFTLEYNWCEKKTKKKKKKKPLFLVTLNFFCLGSCELRALSLKIVKNNVILTHQKATFSNLTHHFIIYHTLHFYSIILYIEIIYTPPKTTIIKPQNQLTTTTQPTATITAQSLPATTTTNPPPNPSIFP